MSRVLTEAKAIAEDADYLFLDRLLPQVDKNPRTKYLKSDFLYRRGIWRGKVVGPVSRNPGGTLLMGHSDRSVSCLDLVLLRTLFGYKTVRAVNLRCTSSMAAAMGGEILPLGLTNPTNESKLHPIFGDVQMIRDVVLKESTEDAGSSIYANFHPGTARKHRHSLYDLCSRTDGVAIGDYSATPEGRRRYLSDMKQAGVVICPRGNGLDTHRFYEALYVGAIPLVLQSSYSARLARHYGLPHIGLVDWREVSDVEGIIQQSRLIRDKPVSLGPIRASFWIAKIRELQSF